MQSNLIQSSVTTAKKDCLIVLSEFELQTFLSPELIDELRSICNNSMEIHSEALSPFEWRELLLRHNPRILISCWGTPALPVELLDSLDLEYVCHLGGSVRRLVPREAIEKGLLVSNWGDTASKVVAECGLMMILACLRRANYWTLHMHLRKGWKQSFQGQSSLINRRVGIHGFGAIARELVVLLRPFDVQISAYSPSVPIELLNQYQVSPAQSLEELFGENEIIVELASLTEQTRNSVLEKHLQLIPANGVFVNIGRGAVVSEEALINVAREGRIQMALDVFHEEPLPADSPLRGLENVFLYPHLAGPTPDKMRDCGVFGVRNVARFFRGLTPLSFVDLEIYDRLT